MRLPDNRKALDGLWELSIIVPLAAFSRHAKLSLVGASQTLRLRSGQAPPSPVEGEGMCRLGSGRVERQVEKRPPVEYRP